MKAWNVFVSVLAASLSWTPSALAVSCDNGYVTVSSSTLGVEKIYAVRDDFYVTTRDVASPPFVADIHVRAEDPYVLELPRAPLHLPIGRSDEYRVTDGSGGEDTAGGNIYVIKLDIEQNETNVCWKATSCTLNLTQDSCPDGTAVWTSNPSGISGRGDFVTFNPSQLAPGEYTVTARSSIVPDYKDTCIVRVTKIELVTPNGDPVASPRVSGDGQNEFTFSSASPGVLMLNLKAKVTPSSAATGLSDCFFSVGDVGSSVKNWAAANPNGKASVGGGALTATVTFTGLPDKNSDFGRKRATISCDGILCDENDYEVFFPRDAKNKLQSEPNWFYYWKSMASGTLIYSGRSGDGTLAEVKGMTEWSYSKVPDKSNIYIYDEVVCKTRPYGVGEELSGIDMFLGVVIHESKHVQQISAADQILSTAGGDAFRYGWSWNQPTHNHWNKGPDGNWGVSGVDDDNNNVLDDARAIPPFEPGNGDDVSLDHSLYAQWPSCWILPNPLYFGLHPIECEAVNVTNNAMNENDNACRDWGAPGKQHLTLNQWSD